MLVPAHKMPNVRAVVSCHQKRDLTLGRIVFTLEILVVTQSPSNPYPHFNCFAQTRPSEQYHTGDGTIQLTRLVRTPDKL
jgi:hypothetical protein